MNRDLDTLIQAVIDADATRVAQLEEYARDPIPTQLISKPVYKPGEYGSTEVEYVTLAVTVSPALENHRDNVIESLTLQVSAAISDLAAYAMSADSPVLSALTPHLRRQVSKEIGRRQAEPARELWKAERIAKLDAYNALPWWKKLFKAMP